MVGFSCVYSVEVSYCWVDLLVLEVPLNVFMISFAEGILNPPILVICSKCSPIIREATCSPSSVMYLDSLSHYSFFGSILVKGIRALMLPENGYKEGAPNLIPKHANQAGDIYSALSV